MVWWCFMQWLNRLISNLHFIESALYTALPRRSTSITCPLCPLYTMVDVRQSNISIHDSECWMHQVVSHRYVNALWMLCSSNVCHLFFLYSNPRNSQCNTLLFNFSFVRTIRRFPFSLASPHLIPVAVPCSAIHLSSEWIECSRVIQFFILLFLFFVSPSVRVFLLFWHMEHAALHQDYITIFDGYTTRDPVILKFCGGGGDGLPAAISSGPELLVEFVTSPYGTFTSSPVQSRTLNGFQLEVSEYTFWKIKTNIIGKSIAMCFINLKTKTFSPDSFRFWWA